MMALLQDMRLPPVKGTTSCYAVHGLHVLTSLLLPVDSFIPSEGEQDKEE